MKIINTFILSAVALSFISCKKDTDSKMMKESYSTETTVVDNNGKVDSVTTTSMEKDANGIKTKSVSFPYKASDGSRAKATFTENGKTKTIVIEANKKQIVLDFKRTAGTSDFYEKNGITAESTKDSLLITQGNNVIHLSKVN